MLFRSSESVLSPKIYNHKKHQNISTDNTIIEFEGTQEDADRFDNLKTLGRSIRLFDRSAVNEIGRASCRERV